MAQKLRFYARPDCFAYPKSAARAFGVRDDYIGRRFVPSEDPKAEGASGAHVATDEPAEFEDGTLDGTRAKKHCRRGHLWAADEATARACGVDFVKVEKRDGEWQPAIADEPNPGASRAAKARVSATPN